LHSSEIIGTPHFLISALRKKLGLSLSGQERFRSIRNTGYVYLLNAASAAAASPREQEQKP
jgi:hypothetical protein